MHSVDLSAALLSGAASIGIGLRSGLLKKEIRTKPNAPLSVTICLGALSAVFGGVSANIWHGAPASWREVFCYAASAVAAWVLLVNVARQKRAAGG